MEYERINHKVQMGVISPSKLRMKLLGVNNNRRKEGGSNSSRTSPSKLEDPEYAKDHLLTNDVDEQVNSIDLKPIPNSLDPKFNKIEMPRSLESQNISKTLPNQVQSSTNSSSVHPMRSLEDDGYNDYDSGPDNGSTSSFEFYKGERPLNPLYRNVPSKWNDAEKWIVNRKIMQTNASKKNMVHGMNKRIDLINPASHNVVKKFSFVPNYLQPKLVLANEKKEDETPAPSVAANKNVESVSMRDVGTEMTPIPSQDPSTTATPLGSITPSRSPRSSSPKSNTKIHENNCQENCDKIEFSESELKLKTRREIAALGMKLGKKNIASWAIKEAEFDTASSSKNSDAKKKLKDEYEARALAWEEAEKAKHMARYKQEEVKIQAWESHQKAKIEARTRKLEVEAERMRAQGQEKIAQKLEETRRQVEERRAYAEARKNQMANQTARKLNQIRQNGRFPQSHIRCCSCFM